MASSPSATSEFPEFDLSFDPSMSNLFPSPPPLPSSGNLFDSSLLSASEQSGILGFLEGFDPWNVDMAHDIPYFDPFPLPGPKATSVPPYSNPHLNTAPEASTSSRPKSRTSSSRAKIHEHSPMDSEPPRRSARARTTTVNPDQISTPTSSSSSPAKSAEASSAASRAKQTLSSPQKRLNHIMSEQKRRNAIRDGYAQLITLLAPDGAPSLDMPTRGKGSSKGKSGVLFRAVEYVKYLEDGRDALREEVLRLEAAAGILPS
ncbi:hypothetical protein DL96DRAFT_1574900 [Flagelloscypha sp. PMI_526]|nr:hypothetical protein DL96DRAFT_1574900 [Flagelloscypha sp. PMI_526]